MASNYATWGWAGSSYGERIYLEITQASQNVANNTTTFNYKIYNNSNNSYGDTGAISWSIGDQWNSSRVTGSRANTPTTSYNQVVSYATGSFTIVHYDDGSLGTVNFKLNISRALGNTKSATVSFSMSVATIPRASVPTLNVATQNIGSAITINTNRASTSFTHTLKYTFGNQSGTIATSVAGSHAWTLPSNLANAIPNAPSGVGTITCETYNGSTHIGTKTVSFTAKVPNNDTFKPNVGISSVTDGALTGYTVYIVNKSRLKVVSTSSGKNGATIREHKVNIAGANYYGGTVTSNVITTAGNVTITVTATDTRGFAKSTSTTVAIQDYFNPVIHRFSAVRETDTSTNLKFSFHYTVASVGGHNGAYAQFRIRESTSSTWSNFYTASDYEYWDDMTVMNKLSVDKSYVIELRVNDNFTTVSHLVNIGTTFALIDFRSTGKGVAFGKTSEKDALEIAMPVEVVGQIKQNGGIDVMNGNVGRLPAGDLNSPTYWSSVKDGVYYTDGSTIWTNSKGAWHIYQKITTTSGWGRVFNYAGGTVRVGNLAGSPLQFNWQTFYSNEIGLMESGRIRAYNSPVITTTGGSVVTQLGFNLTSHLKNPNGYITVENNGFKCHAGGTVRVSFDLVWRTTTSVGYVVASIRRNTEEFARSVEQSWNGAYGSMHVEVITQVNSGHYFQFFVELQLAGTLNVYHSTNAHIEYIAYD